MQTERKVRLGLTLPAEFCTTYPAKAVDGNGIPVEEASARDVLMRGKVHAMLKRGARVLRNTTPAGEELTAANVLLIAFEAAIDPYVVLVWKLCLAIPDVA